MNKKIKIPLLLFMKIKLRRKYDISLNFYNKKKINELIFNDPSLYTARFKEYLILEDENEFLRRFYKNSEIQKKLTTIYNFYAKYSKIFPNYIIIPECKYMYKNIQKKQKMIDNLQRMKRHEKKNRERLKNISIDTILTNNAINSILNQTDSFYKKNLKNIIDISKDDTIKDLNNLIFKIEENEKQVKKSYINIIINKKKKNFSKEFSSLNSQKEEVSKNFRNSQTNITNQFLTEYVFNKTKLKKSKIKEEERYPTIINSTSRNNINHQKIYSQNINQNIKRKILKIDNQNNLNYKNNFENLMTIKIKNKIDKKNLTMKYKENFSMSSSRQKPFIKYNGLNNFNDNHKKISTLSNSPRNDFFSERVEKKIFSKKILPFNNDSRNRNINFVNTILTDNNNSNKKIMKLEQNKRIKIKKLFNQN